MKKKNIFLLISLFVIFSLNSCFLSDLTSLFDNENEKLTLELLNNAFNGKIDNNGNQLYQDFSNLKFNNDFEKAERISIKEYSDKIYKNHYYTPTIGDVNALVIPVEFKDYKAKNLKVNESILPNYQSVASYLYNSSFGQLNINFDILDWQMMSEYSTHYESIEDGANTIKEEVLTKIEKKVDLAKYDNDNDGIIDSLIIIYSAPVKNRNTTYWAYNKRKVQLEEHNGLRTYNFVFAGYDFLFENKKSCNTTTYIHEIGHMLGLDDYYDYDIKVGCLTGGLGGADMMDCNMGDHNVFSKLFLGWVNNPILVKLEKGEETTITIDAYSTNGDCIILSNNFIKRFGLFQDFYILQLLDADNPLNKNQLPYDEDGIRVLRIHGKDDGFYFENNNSYTKYNLIDAINNNRQGYVYTKYASTGLYAKKTDLFYENEGASNMTFYDDESQKLEYGFKVLKIENNKATIQIYRD